MSQIALVSNQHDDDVCVGVVAQLFQPSRDVLECLVLADVVNEQRADCATVVCGGDGAVTLLSGCVPDLRLDRLVVDLDATGRELYTDGGLAVKRELIAGESAEKIGLSDTRVSDKDNWRLLGGFAAGRSEEDISLPLNRNYNMPLACVICERVVNLHRTRRSPCLVALRLMTSLWSVFINFQKLNASCRSR